MSKIVAIHLKCSSVASERPQMIYEQNKKKNKTVNSKRKKRRKKNRQNIFNEQLHF